VQTQRVPTIINTGHEPVLLGAAAGTWSRRPAIALSITEDSLLLPKGITYKAILPRFTDFQ